MVRRFAVAVLVLLFAVPVMPKEPRAREDARRRAVRSCGWKAGSLPGCEWGQHCDGTYFMRCAVTPRP
jgi:hypothetical protein